VRRFYVLPVNCNWAPTCRSARVRDPLSRVFGRAVLRC